MQIPKYDERTVIVGSTGSGKTALGLWHLSKRNYDNRTTIIIDHKIDGNISKIHCKKLKIDSPVPSDGGFYVLYPVNGKITMKDSDYVDERLTEIFWEIWANENYLVYIDEGMMINNNCPGLKALLTQGRSKNIELIILTQRPVAVSRYIFSECDYLGLMRLNDPRDLDTVKKAVGVDFSTKLEEFHSYWLDRRKNHVLTLFPVCYPRESVRIINQKINGKINTL